MALIRLQGEEEKRRNIYYEFDPTSKPLGEGGMGKVYAGRRVNVGTHEVRDVAIKFLFNSLPPSAIEKARREASIIIPHENLVEMMGFLSLEYDLPNGTKSLRYHVISELLTGVTLADLIQGTTTDANGKQVPYAQKLYNQYNQSPEQFAVTIIRKLLSGIMTLHDNGFIHRDIDPSNIMVTNDGKIKLIDFGISKRVDGLITNDKFLTTAGQFIGKPQYAAPELVLGDIKNQDRWTDIYALGILMYQLITGHLPFTGSSNDMLSAHLRKKMPLKDIKDKQLRNIIGKATDKSIAQRYQTAAEMRVAIDGWPKDDTGMMKYIIATVAVASVLGLSVVAYNYLRDEEKEDTTVVVHEEEKLAPKPEPAGGVFAIRNNLLDPYKAEKAFGELQAAAGNGDSEAMFILSRIYAVSIGSFTVENDYATMQANLRSVVTQNPKKAHELLCQIVSKDSSYYPALYELACNYYAGPDMTGGEARDLRKAKALLDKAKKYVDNAGDIGYKNKIEALLRKY